MVNLKILARVMVWLNKVKSEKPICAVCKKKVKETYADIRIEEQTIDFRVICHGSSDYFALRWIDLPYINTKKLMAFSGSLPEPRKEIE